MTMSEHVESQARGVLEESGPGRVVLALPGTDYRVHLVPAGPIATPVGKRIKGTISGKALRIFKAGGGGKFIEPVIGEPRIVAGMVLAVDAPGHRILVDVATPMWLSLSDERQAAGQFAPGEMVNCYVQSGATFTPA